LDWHRRQGHWSLCAYVLMPNHFHAIVVPQGTQTVSSVLQSFDSFTAHAILDHSHNKGCHDLLAFFAQWWDKDAHKRHQVWQPIQAKNVYSAETLREKLEYTRNNPVAKHWQLVADRAEYTYPSAYFYDRGRAPVVEVDDVREWLV
jgi:REP element-mobilizing transposase RayT